ncbi:MAG: PHP domain-containing protein [Candidatus Saccharicenans sp.]|uniref:PHP domain-containing protein n=1 Tax=Candidatus Saccharicenans sp. TaxID=2819258 RepID=UPI00404B7F4B
MKMRMPTEKEIDRVVKSVTVSDLDSRLIDSSSTSLQSGCAGRAKTRTDFQTEIGPNFEASGGNQPIISQEKARMLIKAGWQAADLHVHTFYSYDVVPTRKVDPLVLYEKARARGMSFVSFTDHDTMEAYDRIGWSRDGLVPGVEVKILDQDKVGHTIHINVYMLNRNQFEEIERIARGAQDIELLVEYLRAENLPFTFNHPFWHEPGEKLNARAVVELADKFPVLEYNLGRIRKLNRLVLKLAAEKNRGVAAGTDSHTGDIGRIFTIARGDTFREFFESIKDGRSCLVTEDLNYNRIKDEISQRLEMLIDSQKWVISKKELKMETGNALADAVIETLSGGWAKNLGLKRAILKGVARMVSKTGVPAMIYLRKQNMLANRIQKELTLAA